MTQLGDPLSVLNVFLQKKEKNGGRNSLIFNKWEKNMVEVEQFWPRFFGCFQICIFIEEHDVDSIVEKPM